MKKENKWKNRIRNVLYSYPSDVYSKLYLMEWPEYFPMPRTWSKILCFGDEDIIAKGRDNNGDYIDDLVKSEFSGAYHWIERNEDPKNPELYPHLNEEKNRDYLNDLDGPTDEDLKGMA